MMEQEKKLTKEEIREEIKELILVDYEPHDGWNINLEEVVLNIMEYLDSQGVVMIDEGELPTSFLFVGRSLQETYRQAQQDMLKAGYKRTKPLI